MLTDWKEAYIERKINEKFMQLVTKVMNGVENATNKS
jgi:hypothetical protein